MNEIIDLTNIIQIIEGKSGILAAVLVVVGTLRLTIKPLLTFLHTFVDSTPTLVDNAFLEKVENSRVLKVIFYLLSLFASVKIVPKNIERIDVNKVEEEEEAK